MFNLLLILLNILIYSTQVRSTDPSLIVDTKNGLIQGESVNNGQYYAYKSIPYAEPPMGDLRFEEPLSLKSNWTGILNATQTASKCMQWNTILTDNPIIGSEDCLYLNVFVPQRIEGKGAEELKEAEELLPVMVFIHGGGLMWGSADFYGEQYIMENGGLILVTLNYRLGPLGFLSTEDKEIKGNMGLKDQSMALKWINENIIYFGGNREQVILTGWSAGGASVNFHMVSEMTSDKWFSSAISFSGTALCPCHAVYPGEAFKKSKLMAEYLNCSAEEMNSSKNIKTCLKSKKAADIINEIQKFYKFSKHPFAIFGPVIEKGSGLKFLTDHAENLMQQGSSKTKSWLLARTAEDGAFGTAEFLKKDNKGVELINTLNERWSELAPIMLFFNTTLSKEQQTKLAWQLKKLYFGDEAISIASYKALENLYNEELSTKHVNKVVQLHTKLTPNSKVYGYVYDNPAPYSLGNILAERVDWKFGTLHGDDIFLIFQTEVRREHPLRPDEQEISKNLIQMIVEMAKTGAPVYNGKNLTRLDMANNFKFSTITKDGIEV